MRIYKSAIVGCGRIGSLLDADPKRKAVIWTHAGAYTACPRTALVAFVDSDASARTAAARRWGVKKTYPDLQGLLRDEKIDIVSICTPSSSHTALFQIAAAFKVPAIWCEKPMTTTVAEADRLVALSKKIVTSVNHTRRWDAAYEEAKKTIQAGRIGTPLHVTAWYTNGVANMGSHLFDILRFLLGDVRGVYASDVRTETDPTLSGTLYFENGAIGHVVGYAPGHAFLFEIDILGTRGRLRISDDGTQVTLANVEPSKRYSGYRELAAPKPLWKGQDGRRMVKAVEEIVRGLDHKRATRCTTVDGLKTVELIAAFILSSKRRQPVALPLKAKDRQFRIPVR